MRKESGPSAGGGLDFQDGAHVAVDSRSIQLLAFIARTLESAIFRESQVATLFADGPAIEMGNHRPELKAENAIGAANQRLTHKNSWVAARAERQRSVGNLVNVYSHRRLEVNLHPDGVDSKWPSGAGRWHGSATAA
jgi:uncharacterized protein (DUF2342 family)